MTNFKKLHFLLWILCSCGASSDYSEGLSGGWEFIRESADGKILYRGIDDRSVPCKILAFDYNRDFIVAAQRPTKECFNEKDTIYYKQGKNDIYYWIISHHPDSIYGPLLPGEYYVLRGILKVPGELRLDLKVL